MSTGFRSIPPFTMLNAVSMVADVTSAPVSIERYLRVGLEILVTGAPTGTLTVQASNDYLPNNPTAVANWFDMPLSLTALTGSAHNYIIDIQVLSLPWVRVHYAFSSGTGNITAILTAKEY